MSEKELMKRTQRLHPRVPGEEGLSQEQDTQQEPSSIRSDIEYEPSKHHDKTKDPTEGDVIQGSTGVTDDKQEDTGEGGWAFNDSSHSSRDSSHQSSTSITTSSDTHPNSMMPDSTEVTIDGERLTLVSATLPNVVSNCRVALFPKQN